MATDQSTTLNDRTGKKRVALAIGWWAGFAVVLTGICSGGLWLVFGTVERKFEEFSPNSLQTLTVTQPCHPFNGLAKGSPSFSKPQRSKTMQWLIDSGYHVVPTGYGGWVSTRYVPKLKKGGQADCETLVRSLRDDEWIAWSKRNPESARVLWPLLSKLLIGKDRPWLNDVSDWFGIVTNARDHPKELMRLLQNPPRDRFSKTPSANGGKPGG